MAVKETASKSTKLTTYTVRALGGVEAGGINHKKGSEIKLEAGAESTKALLKSGKISEAK